MATKTSISITIIGHNESYHLKDLLPTLKWADEIIYVDCESDDHSIEIAREQNCRIFIKKNNPNLNKNKAFAMEQANSDWIFYIDPDERISDQLRDEIRAIIDNTQQHNGFYMNRRNHYFGKWLQHGSQYPDIQLRLFRKGFAKFPQKHVHEKLQIEGTIGKLNNDLHHYPYLSISQYLQKFDFYTSFEANFAFESGIKPNLKTGFNHLFAQPFLRFIRRFFFKRGFLDGWQGFFAALFDALNFMVRYLKLKEIVNRSKNDANNEI